jgi:hypothetical protein
VTQELVWGVADFLCRHCQSVLLLVSPSLESSESNLTGKTSAQCSSCQHRTEARDLPQAHQSLIAARLRLLLEDDDLVHASEALASLLAAEPVSQPKRHNHGSSQGRASVSAPASVQPQAPIPTRPTTRQVQPASGASTAGHTTLPVDISSYQLVAKLGAAEATLLSAVPESPVGEIVANRKRDPNFSVVRLRIPIVEPAFFTEIAAELVRYKSSGRRTSLGFSLDEIEALRRGITARRDVVLTKDSMMNTVGLLRFYRMKGSQVAAVEVYRRRSGLRSSRKPLA